MQGGPHISGAHRAVNVLLLAVGQSQAHLRHVTTADGLHQGLGRRVGRGEGSNPLLPGILGLYVPLLLLPGVVWPWLPVPRRSPGLPNTVSNIVPQAGHHSNVTRRPLVQI